MIEKINKWLPIITLVIVLAMALGLVGGNNQSGPLSGGEVGTHFPHGIYAGTGAQFAVDQSGNLTTTGTETIGASGTAQANQVVTSCSMVANLSIVASSTGYADCVGVTGVTSSDNVLASFASTTGTLAQKDNWQIISAKASTTAGAIDFVLYNETGANAVPSAVSKIASTTSIFAGH